MHSGYEVLVGVFGALGAFGFIILFLAIIIISFCITIAPLIIWRNGNRTNRLLALLAFHSGVPANKLKEVYLNGGSQLPESIITKFDQEPEEVKKQFDQESEKEDRKQLIINENQNLINTHSSAIKKMFLDFEWIEPSPFKFYALVKKGSQYVIVELGGFKPKAVPFDKLDNMPKIKDWMEDYLKISES